MKYLFSFLLVAAAALGADDKLPAKSHLVPPGLRPVEASTPPVTLADLFEKNAAVLDDWSASASREAGDKLRATLLGFARSRFLKAGPDGKEKTYPYGARKGKAYELTKDPARFVLLTDAKDARQAGNLVFLDVEKKQLVIFLPGSNEIAVAPIEDVKAIGTVTRKGVRSLVILEKAGDKKFLYSEFPERGAATVNKAVTELEAANQTGGIAGYSDAKGPVITASWEKDSPKEWAVTGASRMTAIDYEKVLKSMRDK